MSFRENCLSFETLPTLRSGVHPRVHPQFYMLHLHKLCGPRAWLVILTKMVRIQILKIKVRLCVATVVFLQGDVSAKNVDTPYHRMQPSAPGVVLRWLPHSEKKGKIEARPSMGRYLHFPGVGNLGPLPVCRQICFRTRQFLRPRQKPVAPGTQVRIHRLLAPRGRSH